MTVSRQQPTSGVAATGQQLATQVSTATMQSTLGGGGPSASKRGNKTLGWYLEGKLQQVAAAGSGEQQQKVQHSRQHSQQGGDRRESLPPSLLRSVHHSGGGCGGGGESSQRQTPHAVGGGYQREGSRRRSVAVVQQQPHGASGGSRAHKYSGTSGAVGVASSAKDASSSNKENQQSSSDKHHPPHQQHQHHRVKQDYCYYDATSDGYYYEHNGSRGWRKAKTKPQLPLQLASSATANSLPSTAQQQQMAAVMLKASSDMAKQQTPMGGGGIAMPAHHSNSMPPPQVPTTNFPSTTTTATGLNAALFAAAAAASSSAAVSNSTANNGLNIKYYDAASDGYFYDLPSVDGWRRRQPPPNSNTTIPSATAAPLPPQQPSAASSGSASANKTPPILSGSIGGQSMTPTTATAAMLASLPSSLPASRLLRTTGGLAPTQQHQPYPCIHQPPQSSRPLFPPAAAGMMAGSGFSMGGVGLAGRCASFSSASTTTTTASTEAQKQQQQVQQQLEQLKSAFHPVVGSGGGGHHQHHQQLQRQQVMMVGPLHQPTSSSMGATLAAGNTIHHHPQDLRLHTSGFLGANSAIASSLHQQKQALLLQQQLASTSSINQVIGSKLQQQQQVNSTASRSPSTATLSSSLSDTEQHLPQPCCPVCAAAVTAFHCSPPPPSHLQLQYARQQPLAGMGQSGKFGGGRDENNNSSKHLEQRYYGHEHNATPLEHAKQAMAYTAHQNELHHHSQYEQQQLQLPFGNVGGRPLPKPIAKPSPPLAAKTTVESNDNNSGKPAPAVAPAATTLLSVGSFDVEPFYEFYWNDDENEGSEGTMGTAQTMAAALDEGIGEAVGKTGGARSGSFKAKRPETLSLTISTKQATAPKSGNYSISTAAHLPNFNVDKFIADSVPPPMEAEKLLRSLQSSSSAASFTTCSNGKTPLANGGGNMAHAAAYSTTGVTPAAATAAATLFQHYQPYQQAAAAAGMCEDSPLYTPLCTWGDGTLRSLPASRYASVGPLSLPMAVTDCSAIVAPTQRACEFDEGAKEHQAGTTTNSLPASFTTPLAVSRTSESIGGNGSSTSMGMDARDLTAMQNLELNLRNVAKIWQCPAF